MGVTVSDLDAFTLQTQQTLSVSRNARKVRRPSMTGPRSLHTWLPMSVPILRTLSIPRKARKMRRPRAMRERMRVEEETLFAMAVESARVHLHVSHI